MLWLLHPRRIEREGLADDVLEQADVALQPFGTQRIAVGIEQRHPGGVVVHDVRHDLAPGIEPLLRAGGIGDRIRRLGAALDVLIAVEGPVVAAFHRSTAAEDRSIEIARIREISIPFSYSHRSYIALAGAADE